MYYNLTVRKLSKTTEAKLKEIASKKGIGVEALARHVLSDFALSPEIQSLDEKYKNLAKDMTALYQMTIQELKEQIEENNYLMNRLSIFLEEREEHE